MKLNDVADELQIDRRKLTAYALDPDNPVGRHKAYVFERILGFTKDHYEPLMRQIEDNAFDGEAVLKRIDQHGNHYSVDMVVSGVQGQSATIRTGWLVPIDSNEAWLTTLYVRKSKK